MPVVREEKIDNFTVMSNNHLRDKNLSLKAKGLLSFMLSLPPDWEYSLAGLCAVCKESKTAIRSTLKELKDHYYLKIEKTKGEKGYYEYRYWIYEKPYHLVEEKEKKEFHRFTLELIKMGYIDKEELEITYYNQLFKKLLEVHSEDVILNSIRYIIPSVMKKGSLDEYDNPIDYKFAYFKNAIINNLDKLNNIPFSLWEAELFDDIEKTDEPEC